MKGTERRVQALVFAALFVSYAYFFQGGGWNPNSRFDLTRAIVEQGTISIDAYRANTDDWALRDGHYYTNKAPGLSFASVPAYALWRALFGPFDLEPALELRLLAYLTNLAANALPSAALGALLFGLLRRLGIESATVRAWSALACGLGTLAFPYSTAYYAHQLTAVLAFSSFALLVAAREREDPRPAAALAGLAGGGAVLCESSALVCIAVLGALLLVDERGRRAAPWFVLGGAPVAAALAAYQWNAFGSPFSPPFRFQNPGVEERIDGALFGIPTPARLWGLLGSSYRGLFFTSPLLALAPFALPLLYRVDRYAGLACALAPLALLGLIASFNAWHGGWAPGPRYLVPSLPFLFVPFAFAARRAPAAAAGLSAISLAVMTILTLIAVEVPTTIENPLFGFALPLLLRGRIAANSQGFDDYWYSSPYDAPDSTHDWASFNLGELVFPGSVLSALPLLCMWAGFAWAIARETRRVARPE